MDIWAIGIDRRDIERVGRCGGQADADERARRSRVVVDPRAREAAACVERDGNVRPGRDADRSATRQVKERRTGDTAARGHPAEHRRVADIGIDDPCEDGRVGAASAAHLEAAFMKGEDPVGRASAKWD